MSTDFAGRSVLFLMAAEAEYGRYLRDMFAPVITGVGPVESAVVATATLANLTEARKQPELVVSLGSAGSRVLEHCGVYQANALAYRDMDASALGFERGVTPFLDLPARVQLAHHIPGLRVASLSTGANIVSGMAYDSISEDMVDMESYAIWRACQHFSVPLIVLRGISDGAVPLEGLHSWTEYLDIIDQRLAGAVEVLRGALSAGQVEGLS